jgi:serine/threonine protein kinase
MQAGFEARLAGTTPADFHPEGIAVYTAVEMAMPIEFASIARAIGEPHREGRLPEEEARLLSNIPVVLVFCNMYDSEECRLAGQLASCIEDSLDREHPLLVMVPTCPLQAGESYSKAIDDDAELQAMTMAIDTGFDGVVFGQPCGIQLACEVQSEIMKSYSRINRFNRSLRRHLDKVQYAKDLEDDVHDIVWDYLRQKTRSSVPRPNYQIAEVQPGSQIGNYAVGRAVGEGAFGKVHMLYDAAGYDDAKHPSDSPSGQVVKVILKQPRTSLLGLKDISNTIRVMTELSLPKWEHPNIVKFYEVYHLSTQVALRMEDGGSRNLYSYFRCLESRRLPLGEEKATSILVQSTDALCHLHLGPTIAHRDIKPENMLLHESADGIKIKICDFDLSKVIRPSGLCATPCGSFPFMAPEIMEGNLYNPYAADVWSMGVVFLEMVCGLKIISKVVHNGRMPAGSGETRTMTSTIGTFFRHSRSVENVCQSHFRHELRDSMLVPVIGLLAGMMNVQVPNRWAAEKLQTMSRFCKIDLPCEAVISGESPCSPCRTIAPCSPNGVKHQRFRGRRRTRGKYATG